MFEETKKALGVINLMKASGALLEGHFELASGLHSDRYVQCALLLQIPERAEYVGRHLGMCLREALSAVDADLVVSPALGGIVISHEVGRALGARAVFMERVDGKMSLRRGFDIRAGEKAVVVEDVVTTGGSTREVMDAVGSLGGEVAAVGAVVNRSGNIDFGVPFSFLVKAEIENYQRDACPMCRRGVPLTKPGTKALNRKPAC